MDTDNAVDVIVNEEPIPDTPVCDEGATVQAPEPETVPTSTYWKFVDELEGSFRAFISEARAGELNKQACLRARKLSLNLRKCLKEYHSVAVAHDKTHGRKTKGEVKLNKELETL